MGIIYNITKLVTDRRLTILSKHPPQALKRASSQPQQQVKKKVKNPPVQKDVTPKQPNIHQYLHQRSPY